jgi:AraC-like DNA-binding protein
VETQAVLALQDWGVREFVRYDDIQCDRALAGLITRAALGTHVSRLKAALVQRVAPEVRDQVEWVLDAALAGVATQDRSVASLAKRVYMSPATLGRCMGAAGLITPSRFTQRVRVILALLLRTDPATRDRAWMTLGFGSPVHLSNRVRSHLGRPMGEFDQVDVEALLPDLVEGLLQGSSRRVRKMRG